MKLYTCSNCQNLLYFENNICLQCQHTVGFDATALSLITLDPNGPTEFTDFTNKEKHYRFCENAVYGTCNWLVPVSDPSTFCQACALNRVIPTLSEQINLDRWKKIEVAKHRLVYSLLRLHLPVVVKVDDEVEGIAFDFMADTGTGPDDRVMTGHDNGVITLNIEEADDAARARNKMNLGEKYRTLLGHFRHEVGHYYWDVLIKDSDMLDKYRKLFGDEQGDYGEALEAYYKTGAPLNWIDNFISPYASSHSWEDWAETWAHYLHMMDTLETAYAFGISIKTRKASEVMANKENISKQDPYDIPEFDKIIKLWLPIMFSVNSLNRSMGHADFYPFIISAPVIEKLRFIHELCFKYSHQKLVSA